MKYLFTEIKNNKADSMNHYFNIRIFYNALRLLKLEKIEVNNYYIKIN